MSEARYNITLTHHYTRCMVYDPKYMTLCLYSVSL